MGKLSNWIIALLGLWEFGDIAALFVPGYGRIQAGVWGHIIAGFFLMIAGAWGARTRNAGTARTLDRIAVILGLWLMAGRFVLAPPGVMAAVWNDVIVGAVVVAVGGWNVIRAAG